MKIDKLGLCPNCNESWKGEDILDHLSRLDLFSNKTAREIEKVANKYGWTKENPASFSTTLIHEVDNKTYIECPKCMHLFNMDNKEEEYTNLYNWKENNPLHTSSSSVVILDLSNDDCPFEPDKPTDNETQETTSSPSGRRRGYRGKDSRLRREED